MAEPTFTQKHILLPAKVSPEEVSHLAIESRLENMEEKYLRTQDSSLLKSIVYNLQDVASLRRMNESLSAMNARMIRFQQLTVNRELKMVELKKENDELRAKLGTTPTA